VVWLWRHYTGRYVPVCWGGQRRMCCRTSHPRLPLWPQPTSSEHTSTSVDMCLFYKILSPWRREERRRSLSHVFHMYVCVCVH